MITGSDRNEYMVFMVPLCKRMIVPGSVGVRARRAAGSNLRNFRSGLLTARCSEPVQILSSPPTHVIDDKQSNSPKQHDNLNGRG
jgi:hypothetical protein